MVDPKMVELGVYNGIPHLLIPVVTDPKKAAGALQWAVTEMMRRYRLMADEGVRDLASYNKQAKATGEFETMPQIVVVIDELADLMLVASRRKLRSRSAAWRRWVVRQACTWLSRRSVRLRTSLRV